MPEIKKKRKKWYPILASKEFRQVEIGETLTSSPESLVGKTIQTNLMQLTNDMKKQNTKITFKIIQVKDDKALTEIKKYELIPVAVKRLSHKEKNKLETSFTAKTKDNIQVQIKPLLVTKSKTKKSILSNLLHETKTFLTKEINRLSYTDLLNTLIYYKIQNQLKFHLKKIYPLSVSQIRCLVKK